MSVSQVKKRFEDMEGYLCRDKEGLRRLKLLKDDVNVLRTSLAAAVEAKETAEAIKDAARERADRAEAELADLKLEVEKHRSIAVSLESKVAILVEQLEEKSASDNNTACVDEEAAAKRMMRDLEQVMRYCPKALTMGGKINKNTQWFSRQSLATGWSRSEIWKLGASIAALVMLEGQLVVYSEETFRTMKKKRAPATTIGSFARPFLRWFRNNIRKAGADEAWSRLSDEEKRIADERCKIRDVGEMFFAEEDES